MAQRGRVPAAALSVVPRPDGQPERLKPPSNLTAAEREAFIFVVSACDRRHFVPSDTPLLAAYARAIVADETAAKMLREHGSVLSGRPSPWLAVKEKAHKEMISLSLRLRLSPQGRAQHPPKPEAKVSYYERMRMERRDEED